MKKLATLLVGIALLTLSACSDPKDSPLQPQNEVSVHGEGWMSPASTNFHGKVLAAQSYKSEDCRQCHGSQYDGGVTGVSCKKCHTTFPHSANWQNTGSPEFHGKVLAAKNYNLAECQLCHGNTFDGGTSQVSCRTCHASYPHPADWLNATSANYHGAVLAAQNYDAKDCQLCHGSDLNGGTSEVSCRKCHASYPHPADWISGATSHFVFLKSNQYDLASCQSCHGQNYGTVKGNTSCLTCHTKQGGPEACNTCHGNASGEVIDFTTWAPPQGLDNETATSSPAVGAHQTHLSYYAPLSACSECHVVPSAFVTASHVDDNNRAETVFGPLGTLVTEGGSRMPMVVYDFNANTCSNSYCHGNWGLLKSQSKYDFIYAAEVISGAAATPKWTDSGSVACGSCHGLPPIGHNPFDISACATCHQGVIDAFGVITDKTKHINGKVNVFNEEYPMK